MESPLVDGFGRAVSYLRVSVTDRCNLRCWYCMPNAVRWLPKDDILTYEELLRVVSVGAGLGISKVRLTGGEPLVRKGLPAFVGRLVEIEGIREVTLTTNGILLTRHAAELKACGLRRVNVSLDTLDSTRYEGITRGGRLRDAIAGIDAAIAAGLLPIKLNAVLSRDSDIGDIRNLIRFARSKNVSLRFIELMPLLHQEHRLGWDWKDKFISADEVKDLLASENLEGIEFLSPVSRPFCDTCNRLRLTSDGKLLACLCRGGFVDVRKTVRSGADCGELVRAFRECLNLKPEPWREWGENAQLARVSAIGG